MVADPSSEIVVLAVKVHFVEDSSGYYTSTRTDAHVSRIFDRANDIWSRAAINFRVDETVQTKLSAQVIFEVLSKRNRPNQDCRYYLGLCEHENFNKHLTNVFLALLPDGPNGFALPVVSSAFVSDDTGRVNDFRTTAHELGHLLELVHVGAQDRLMARGWNGEVLSESEILIARENARIRASKEF